MTSRAVSNMKLNLDDLKDSRRKLSDSINITRSQAFDALDHHKITSSQFQDAKYNWQMLQIQESQLTGQIISLQLDFLLDTNVNSPLSRIIQATDKLKAATTNIQEFEKFLGSITDVIEIFASVIKAIQNRVIVNIP